MSDKTLGAYERRNDAPGPLEQAADRIIALVRDGIIPASDDMDGGVTAALIEKEHPGPCGRSCCWKEDGHDGPCQPSGRPHPDVEAPLIIERLRAQIRGLQEAESEAWARAAKAEDERDEARADCNDALRREKAEQDRADKAKRERDAAVDSALFAAVSRPLTPDAISDQFVDYVHEDYFWSTEDRVRLEKPALKHALLDAVKRLAEASARPEGAEELGQLIGTWTATEDIAPAQPPTGSLATLADFLAEHGVRVVTEEDPR